MTERLAQQETALSDEIRRHAATTAAMHEISMEERRIAEEKIMQLEANHRTVLDAAIRDSNKSKDKIRCTAEEQFANARKQFTALKQELASQTKNLEREASRRLELDESLKHEQEETRRLRYDITLLKEEAAAAIFSKEEALSLCEEAVRENEKAKTDAARACYDATAAKEAAFFSLARATQELSSKEAEISCLKKELADSSRTCEELFAHAERLQEEIDLIRK